MPTKNQQLKMWQFKYKIGLNDGQYFCNDSGKLLENIFFNTPIISKKDSRSKAIGKLHYDKENKEIKLISDNYNQD